jgi:hypothetical protein
MTKPAMLGIAGFSFGSSGQHCYPTARPVDLPA